MHTCIENQLVKAFRMGLAEDQDQENLAAEFLEGIRLYGDSTFIDAVEDIRGLMTLARDMGRDCKNSEAAYQYGQQMTEVVVVCSVSLDEWKTRYNRIKAVGEAIRQQRDKRALRLCSEAGLDPKYIGVHLNNAKVAMEEGRPWENVDYSKVDECIDVYNTVFDYSGYIHVWDAEIRAFGENIEPR